MLARMSRAANVLTRLPPPPRKVHGGGGFGLWFIRLFILPHMCVGVGMVGFLVLNLLVAAFGTGASAVVTHLHTSRGNKGSTAYHVDYHYTLEGREFSHSGTVGAAAYAALPRPKDLEGPASTLPVRHLNLGRWHYQVITLEGSAWKTAGGILLFALFWNGILSVFVYVAWVAPLRARWLVRGGQTTMGMILTSRAARGSKSTSYYATFRFRDPATGQEIQREMSLPGLAQYNEARAGREVTVIYQPEKPRRALVYELSGYRVDQEY